MKIGRIVWYRMAGDMVPYPALVCWVWADGTINVVAFTREGHDFRASKVPMCKKPPPGGSHWCEWMPK